MKFSEHIKKMKERIKNEKDPKIKEILRKLLKSSIERKKIHKEYLAKMSPEEREAEKRANESIRKSEEERDRKINLLEAKLTPKEKKLREEVREFISLFARLRHESRFDNVSEFEKYRDKSAKELKKEIEKLLKKVNFDVKKIKRVLISEKIDSIYSLGGELEYFKEAYDQYKLGLKNGKPILKMKLPIAFMEK